MVRPPLSLGGNRYSYSSQRPNQCHPHYEPSCISVNSISYTGWLIDHLLLNWSVTQWPVLLPATSPNRWNYTSIKIINWLLVTVTCRGTGWSQLLLIRLRAGLNMILSIICLLCVFILDFKNGDDNFQNTQMISISYQSVKSKVWLFQFISSELLWNLLSELSDFLTRNISNYPWKGIRSKTKEHKWKSSASF